jgi:hypothetical protein
MSTSASASPSNPVSRAGAGVFGGLAAGVVLGILLKAMDLLPLFAKMVGRSSSSAAWSVELGIAAVAGAVYGILVGRSVSRQIVSAGGIGLLYGAGLGLLFILLVLPLVAGKGVFAFNDSALRGIGTYALFGVITGIIYAVAGPKRRYYYDDEDGPRRQSFSFTVGRRTRRTKSDND